jgi:hypothetical protein
MRHTPPLRGVYLALPLVLACSSKQPAVVAAAPAPEAPTANAEEAASDAAAPRLVDEKVTVVNPTKFTINVELSSAAPDQEPGEPTSFGPIEPGGEASGSIRVWTNGSFTVLARWEAGGEPIESRPYTAMLQPTEPLTPVTVTLNIPYDSGSMGLWSAVEWEMPPGME